MTGAPKKEEENGLLDVFHCSTRSHTARNERPAKARAVVHDAHAEVRNEYLTVNVVGTGANVVRQVPEAGTVVSKWSTVILYTDDSEAVEEGVVPDLLGLSVAEATEKLAAAGLTIEIVAEDADAEGLVAISQTPEAGTVLAEGTVVTVEFAVKPEEE